MKVRNVMTSEIVSCADTDALDKVAKTLWDHDCGAVFVRNEGGDVVGALTDRDIAMAAWMQGRALHEIAAESALGGELHSCRAGDDLVTALDAMGKHQLRRLPVRDGKRWVGVVTLADAARAVDKKPRAKSVSQAHVAHCLAMICSPRAASEAQVEIQPAPKAKPAPSKPAKSTSKSKRR